MNTFRNKHFKNKLDQKYAFYDFHRTCELRNTSQKALEECSQSCESKILRKDLDIQK